MPGRILVAGSALPIALEFAHIFHGLGKPMSPWSIAAMKPLRGFSTTTCADMRFAILMKARGLDVALGCEFTKVEKRGDCLHAEDLHQKGGVIECDQISAGHRPPKLQHRKALHVDKAGVELGMKGEVVVDDYSRTSAPHIYAIGDHHQPLVQLTPAAIREAIVAPVRNRLQAQSRPGSGLRKRRQCSIHLTPELAVVGMSEEKALGTGHSIDVYKSTLPPTAAHAGRATGMHDR